MGNAFSGDAKKAKDLSSGQLAREAGTTVRAVRFYEQEGLLSATRKCGGRRCFPPQQLEQLQLILQLRSAGISLADIKDMMSLKDRVMNKGASESASMFQDAIGEHIRSVEAKIATLTCLQNQLERLRDKLQTCVQCENPAFPKSCGPCERVTVESGERALTVLWKHATCGD